MFEQARDNFIRSWIRRMMWQHRLKEVFAMINEEYRRVYTEDNFATRQDFLHELVDTTDPDSYIWGKLARSTKCK